MNFFFYFILFLFVHRESVVSRLSLISIEAGVGVDLKKVSTAVVLTKIVRSNARTYNIRIYYDNIKAYDFSTYNDSTYFFKIYTNTSFYANKR